MDQVRTDVDIVYCPSCFRRGLEQRLRYDEQRDTWYCLKCLYTGGKDQAVEAIGDFVRMEYPKHDIED